ncbi:hypothetical protein HAX54_022453, partial [Datura stramonium]|nr:hypothetical protein [Datura stramonium]
MVIPPSQPQNGTTADMTNVMFQKTIESLVEKIQTQRRVNMMPGENNKYNQSEEPLHSTRSVELAAYHLQDIAEKWFKSFKAWRPDVEASNEVVT